jgi:O-antigen ligase
MISLLVFFIPAAAITLPHSIGTGTALLLLMSLFVIAYDRTLPPLDRKEKQLLTSFGLFAAYGLFSIIWLDESLSLFDTPSRFALAVPIYLLLRRSPPSRYAFWLGTATGAIGGGVLALYQRFILGLPHDAIGYTHHIRFGDISLVLGGIACAGLPYFSKVRRGILVPMAALAFGIIGSILSGARGGWPAIPILLYCLYRQNFKSYSMIPKVIKITAPVMGLIAVIIFLYSGGQQRATAAISDVQQYQLGQRGTSVGLRFEMWKVSEQAFFNHPILGVGKNGFISTTQKMASSKVIDKMALELDHAHNDFLDTLAKRGLLGLMTLLLIFIVPAHLFIQTLQHGNEFQKPYGVAGLILVMCYVIFSLTDTMFLLTLPTTFYAFSVVVLCASAVPVGNKEQPPGPLC